jgi:hypothetical protein
MLQALVRTHALTLARAHMHTHTQTVQTMVYDPKPKRRNTYIKTMVHYETGKLAVNNSTNKLLWSVGVT